MLDWTLDNQTKDLAVCRDAAAGATYHVRKSGEMLSLTVGVNRAGYAPVRLTLLPFSHFGTVLESIALWRHDMMGIQPVRAQESEIRIARGRVAKPDPQNIVRLSKPLHPRFASALIIRSLTAAELGKDVTAAATQFSRHYTGEKFDSTVVDSIRLKKDVFEQAMPRPPVAPITETPKPESKVVSQPPGTKAATLAATETKPFRADPPIPIREVLHERVSIGAIYKLDARAEYVEEPGKEEGSLLSRFLRGRKH